MNSFQNDRGRKVAVRAQDKNHATAQACPKPLIPSFSPSDGEKVIISHSLVVLLMVFGLAVNAFSAVTRPLSGKGAEAKTLLLYSATRTAYSMGDALELMKLHLNRVATRLETVSISDVNADKISGADYLVVFCPEPLPKLGTNFLKAVAVRKTPVLWVGFGADQLDTVPNFPWVYEISPTAMDQAAPAVKYAGQTWKTPVFPWLTVNLNSSANAKTIMSLADGESEKPLCWQMGNYTFYAGVPVGEGIGFLFSDMLLDFFEVKEIPESRVFLRIEDYSAQSNHREVLRMVDFLYGRGIPFMLGVIPSIRNTNGQAAALGSAPEFASALRYAQQHGGRLVLHGATHALQNETGEGHEFWDTEQDRPLADESPGSIRERIQGGAQQLIRHGLLPLAWETPSYNASRQTYRAVAQIFSTAVERVQLSDTTGADRGVTAGLTIDAYGRLVVPENLGFVLSGETNCCEQINANGEMLTHLRGTVAGCYLHAYQPLEKLTRLVETLSAFKKPFLDLADLDNAVVLPGRVLLTGNAQRSVTLKNATVVRKTFDRAGKLLKEEKEPELSNGERTFQRNAGDCELIEYSEGESK
jgi:uncharacterized protein YdaL